ncbi:phage head spike fiber domain-containing protein [Aeromonas media]|uniref:phage head spike fiber domain-containing protein n=1 Tax=Aeromonas media TaxID=651 RepID=UPI0015DC930D|nr:LamG-like jellyroll fold domain-containing protein [Aeromonas media]BBS88038.1 hypothetical protein WP7W18E02_29350 [Aeromonas media]
MAGVWKRDGTVAVTNGNKKVTGTGTTFADTKNGVAKGHLFCITSGTSVDFYEVDYVVSNTELYLVQAYRGVTATGKAYEIITTFSDSVPEFARRLTATLSAYQQQSDAFQALLTSNAATIEVTAPDGTKQTLIPWKRVTSEGEGQTARAKVEADRAKTEADRSKAEADRSTSVVANAARDAALPFPDVWAPLSDSLRLFAGFGREVKVGSDVVARYLDFQRATTATYVDKSGVLKTAAINEPRFEKEGLLIEGASTNLATYSEEPNRWSSTGVTKVENTDKSLTITSTSPGYPRVSLVASSTINLVAGDAMTATYWLKPEGAPIVHLAIDVAGGLATLRATVDRVTLAVNKFLAGASIGATTVTAKMECGLIKIVMTLNVTAAATFGGSFVGPAAAGGSPAAAGTGESTTVVRGQLEKLPFATSYIPTQAAAVTRAADSLSMPSACNVNPINTDVTYAMQVEYKGFQIRPFRTDAAISPSGAGINSVGAAWFFTDTTVNIPVSSVLARIGMNDFVAHNNANGAAVYLNGEFGGSRTPSRGAAPTDATKLQIGANHAMGDPINGHVRNVRIWHTALTDAQAKAIR